MKLSSLIDRNFVVTGKNFESVIDAVDYLIDLFEKKNHLPVQAAEVKRIVREREKLGGTILPSGIAIPHGRVEGFKDLLMGVWIPKTALETDSGTARVVFFFITSKVGAPLYLPVLSSLSASCKKDDLIEKITGADINHVFKIFDSIIIKKEITVEDVMTVNLITCKADTTLAELADLLYKNKLSYLPVVDNNNMQIGEVTTKDLLSCGIPDYVKRLGDLSFLKTLEPFEALLRNEETIQVKEIMRSSSRHINKDASIIEAVSIILSKGYRHLPVFDNKQLVGVISETDILQKVLRG